MILRSAPRLVVAASLAAVVAVLVPSAAAAPPPSPVFGAAIDPYASYQGQTTCATSPTPGAVALRDMVRAAYPGIGSSGPLLRSCGSGGTSEHKDGRAWDWMVDARVPAEKAAADELLAWLTAPDEHGNAHARLRRMGIMYMIYDGKVFKAYQAAKGWQPYTGSNPHVDHVHFSLGWPGARQQTTWWGYGAASWAVATPSLGFDGDLLRIAAAGPSGSAGVGAWTGGGSVTAAEDLGGRILGGASLARRGDGGLVVAVRGANDRLYVKERPAGGVWSAWNRLDGALSARPALTASPSGGLDVAVRGTNGVVYTRTSDRPGSWSPWQAVRGLPTSAVGPALASSASGTSVFAVHADGSVWRSQRVAGTWGAWSSLGGRTADDLAAAGTGTGAVSVVVRGTNDVGYVRTVGGGVSSGWTRLGGVLASGPGAAGTADGSRIDVAVWGTNGRLYRLTGDGRSWTGWSAIG